MSFLNSIVADLREKRLWPVAAALCAALVAVPVVLAKSTPAAPPSPAPPAAPVTAATAVTAVSVDSAVTHSPLSGRTHDPFIQQKMPGAPRTITPAASSTTSSAVGKASSTNRRTSTSPGGGTGTTPTTTPQPSVRYFVYSVDIVFGNAGSHKHVYHDVPRLTPFPSAKDPVLVFLGVKTDGKTLVFLVSSFASPTGDGSCAPRQGRCNFLDLKAGEPELLLVRNANGSVSVDRLEVAAIRLTATPSVENARLAYARVSSVGQQIVSRARRHSAALRAFSYSPDTGLLSHGSASNGFLVHQGRLPAGGGTGVVLGPASSVSR